MPFSIALASHHILSLEGHMGAHRTFESNFSTTGPHFIFGESLVPIFLEDFLKRFLTKGGVYSLTRRAFAGWSPSLKRVFDLDSSKRVASISQLTFFLLMGLTWSSLGVCSLGESLDLNLTERVTSTSQLSFLPCVLLQGLTWSSLGFAGEFVH